MKKVLLLLMGLIPLLGIGQTTQGITFETGTLKSSITELSPKTNQKTRANTLNPGKTNISKETNLTITGLCTTPPDQDFGNYSDITYGASIDYQCIVYSGSDCSVAIGDISSQGITASPVFSGSAAVILGNSAGGYGEFYSTNGYNFKLVSFAAEFFGHSNGYCTEIYNVVGYRDNDEVVRANNFRVTESGTAGSGTATITWVREDFDTDGSNSGVLSFGAGWQNIDKIRFEVAENPGYYLYIGLDNINFEVAVSSSIPTITTASITVFNATSATMGGEVTADGGASVTERGVVYSSSDNTPEIGETGVIKDDNGTGTGIFEESVLGLSPNTIYHVRAYATNTAGTAYGDDVTFTTLTNGTFTGTASNDWATAGNWAGGSVPTAGTDVTIPAGKTAEIAPGTSANCNNITIDPAGSLTIKSDVSNAGSLIVSGTATGNVTYQSYLAETGKWHVVTAPVTGQNVWGFATLAGNSIAEKTGKRAVTEYIEATNTWDTNYPTADTEGSFAAGSGYSVLRSDAGVVSYTGTINTSDVSKPITRGLYGWNALGNPYTSAINATETAHATNNLITANASKLDPFFAALYVWDAASGQYVTINNTGTGSLVQNYIQAGQGFFVRAKDNSGLNFSITEAMQTHQPATPLKSAENTWPTILLTAKSNNKLSSTMVTFNSQMTNGLDVTYDAGMFKADKIFALYSKLVDDNGNDFAIQALPEKFEGLIIPLGIDAPAGTEISFSAGIFNLPGEATVYLEDRASNQFTKLDATEAVYTVTITDQTKGAGNFYLHTSAATTGIENQKNGIQVYTRDRAIFVNGNLDAKDVVAVYGIDGKLHYKNIAGQNGLLRIDAVCLPAGVYLVSISQKAGRVTHKIILGE